MLLKLHFIFFAFAASFDWKA